MLIRSDCHTQGCISPIFRVDHFSYVPTTHRCATRKLRTKKAHTLHRLGWSGKITDIEHHHTHDTQTHLTPHVCTFTMANSFLGACMHMVDTQHSLTPSAMNASTFGWHFCRGYIVVGATRRFFAAAKCAHLHLFKRSALNAPPTGEHFMERSSSRTTHSTRKWDDKFTGHTQWRTTRSIWCAQEATTNGFCDQKTTTRRNLVYNCFRDGQTKKHCIVYNLYYLLFEIK